MLKKPPAKSTGLWFPIARKIRQKYNVCDLRKRQKIKQETHKVMGVGLTYEYQAITNILFQLAKLNKSCSRGFRSDIKYMDVGPRLAIDL